MGNDSRREIAARCAQEIRKGMVVNLGIGLPVAVADFVPSDLNVLFHSENGVLGLGGAPARGAEDPNLCNAGGLPATVVAGASYFDSSLAFGIIRAGLIDISILGALQVSAAGDLANWIIPGKSVPGVGGGVDLAQKARRVIVAMKHLAKDGTPKIVERCSIPITAPGCVDTIVTERAVFRVVEGALLLTEIRPPYDLDVVKSSTAANFELSPELREPYE